MSECQYDGFLVRNEEREATFTVQATRIEQWREIEHPQCLYTILECRVSRVARLSGTIPVLYRLSLGCICFVYLLCLPAVEGSKNAGGSKKYRGVDQKLLRSGSKNIAKWIKKYCGVDQKKLNGSLRLCRVAVPPWLLLRVIGGTSL